MYCMYMYVVEGDRGYSCTQLLTCTHNVMRMHTHTHTHRAEYWRNEKVQDEDTTFNIIPSCILIFAVYDPSL